MRSRFSLLMAAALGALGVPESTIRGALREKPSRKGPALANKPNASAMVA
jgi:hypothetical protein